MTAPGSSGRRSLDVSPERLAGWLERFAAAHGGASVQPTGTAPEPDVLDLVASDGARARLHVPFPPLVVDPDAAWAGLVAHASRSRRVGVLLVRRGGYAVGVADGTRLVASKVGSRHVQGRTAAGGWSQQRFARRRDQQSREAFAAAADVAARLLAPEAAALDAVVTGGDRGAVAAVLADARLAPLRPLVSPRLLDVPDPRHAVLADSPHRFRAVRVEVTDPPS